MTVDETLMNKGSEDMTSEDVRTLLHAPPEEERPLIEPGIFDEKQPARPIYKSIPLKFALAGAVALIVMVPVMRLFSGNLISGNNSTIVSSTEENEETETEEEEAQRLVIEENAALKRELALQNQSFTAQDIEDTNQEGTAQTQNIPTQPVTARPPTPQQPTPVSRPVAAVASRSAPVREATVRPDPPARTTPPSRPALETATAETPSQTPVSLSEISAAGNYGQLPSRPIAGLAPAQTAAPIAAESDSHSFVTVANRASSFAPTDSIPVSVRSQTRSAAPQAASDVSDTNRRPLPRVMEDATPAVSVELTQLEPELREEIALNEADTYEAQRDLIMGETEGLRGSSALSSLLLPGSTAELEVTTAVTWTSDLPRATGSVTLISPLSSNGAEILPQGAELIVQIGDISASGTVALDVVAMVLPGSSEVAEINIPTGALEVLAADGGYPVARAEQSAERQLQAIDRQQALLGAMGAVGDYLNRPQRETNVFGLGGSSSSREYGSGSLWGSLLSGAANEMLRSRSDRLDVEAERLMERPTIWSIESGRRLQLFVTQEVEL